MLIEQELGKVLMFLVEDRAYPVVLPQGVKYPAITFHRLNGGWRSGQMNGLLKLVDITGFQSEFQVAIWSPKYSEVSWLMPDVVNAVETIESMELDAAVDNYEDKQGKKIFCKVIDFTAWENIRNAVCPAPRPEQNNPFEPVTSAIVGTIKERLGAAVALVDLYENQQMNLTVDLPAVLIEPHVLGKTPPRGDNTFPLQVSFTAYCLMPTGADQRLNAQWLAAQVVDVVDFNHWTLGRMVDHPEIQGIDSYTLRPGCNGFECWQVQWNQVMYLERPEPAPMPVPDDLYASKAPEIGLPNKPNYQQLTWFNDEPV